MPMQLQSLENKIDQRTNMNTNVQLESMKNCNKTSFLKELKNKCTVEDIVVEAMVDSVDRVAVDYVQTISIKDKMKVAWGVNNEENIDMEQIKKDVTKML